MIEGNRSRGFRSLSIIITSELGGVSCHPTRGHNRTHNMLQYCTTLYHLHTSSWILLLFKFALALAPIVESLKSKGKHRWEEIAG